MYNVPRSLRTVYGGLFTQGSVQWGHNEGTTLTVGSSADTR